jgi:predicted acetyltransferase
MLDNIPEKLDVINMKSVYRRLNLLPRDEYNVVVSDEVISLSVYNNLEAQTINQYPSQILDIVLNSTHEKIGNIEFDYSQDVLGIGNVFYKIEPNYRNKGYASRALSLLKQLVVNNNFKGDKNLYFFVSDGNKYSQRVVLKNGGEVIKNINNDGKIYKITI